MALEIPSDDTGAIERIKALPPASIDKLISAIKGAPLISDPKELAAHIAKRVPSLAGEKLVRIMNTLFTLYHIRELSGVPPSKFLNDLMDGLKESLENVPARDFPKLALTLV